MMHRLLPSTTASRLCATFAARGRGGDVRAAASSVAVTRAFLSTTTTYSSIGGGQGGGQGCRSSMLAAATKTTTTALGKRTATFSSSMASSYSHRSFSTSGGGDVQSELGGATEDETAGGREGKGVFDRIALIGAGKMAEAMLSPLIATNLQPPSAITVFDVSTSTLDHIAQTYPGVTVSKSIPEALSHANLAVIAVKPQNCPRVFAEIRRALSLSSSDDHGPDDVNIRSDLILLSVVAGKPVRSFVDGTGLTRVARSMPNTPAQIGKGVTVWNCTDNIDADDKKRIDRVLKTFGKAIFVDDESFIDMSTSISGSGPAYIFLLMEAMIDAGVHMGFSRSTATTLVHHTLLGSTLYAMETGEHPAILRNSVTSPAGTTASAIYELENGKFRTVIKDAIWACYRRSLEMGGHDSNVGPGRAESPPMFVPPPPSAKHEHHPVEAPAGEVADVPK